MLTPKWIDGAIERVAGPGRADLAKVTTGGVLLMLGAKATPLYLFQSGLRGLEADWRLRHGFQGSLRERWREATAFYESTHQNQTNRVLHIVGIPLIVGGTAGLLLLPSWTPPWGAALGAFTFGWALNLLGHKYFEKNAPAFEEDPLSFLAGPVWDVTQLRKLVKENVRVRVPSFLGQSA